MGCVLVEPALSPSWVSIARHRAAAKAILLKDRFGPMLAVLGWISPNFLGEKA